MSELAQELERQLSVIARNLRQPTVLADGSVVRRTTVTLLYVLAEMEPVRMGAVSAAMNLDPSTTTRQVQDAKRLGLVTQVPDTKDRRAHQLSLSTAGRDLYDSVVERQRGGLLRLLDGWPDRDQTDLVRLLSLFNAEMSQLRAAASAIPGHPAPVRATEV